MVECVLPSLSWSLGFDTFDPDENLYIFPSNEVEIPIKKQNMAETLKN